MERYEVFVVHMNDAWNASKGQTSLFIWIVTRYHWLRWWDVSSNIGKEKTWTKKEKCWMGDQVSYWLRLCGRAYRKLLRRHTDRCTMSTQFMPGNFFTKLKHTYSAQFNFQDENENCVLSILCFEIKMWIFLLISKLETRKGILKSC